MRQLATALVAFLIVAVKAFAAPGTSPQVELVAKLYSEFAFEAVVEEPEKAAALFIEQPRKVLVRYLDSRLAALVLADRQCVKKTKEICRLDFSPLWGNQDPVGGTAKITQGPSADLVFVQIRSGTSTTSLKYKLAKTQNGWKITDIEYSDGSTSLRRMLEAPQ